MTRRRIEYDPDTDPAATIELAEAVRALLTAQRGGADPLGLVTVATDTEHAAENVVDAALLAADEHHSRRAIATAYGRSHDAVNRRIRRIHKEEPMSRKQANAEHRDAKDELERISKRDRAETDDYLAANQRVADAEQHVSWWKR